MQPNSQSPASPQGAHSRTHIFLIVTQAIYLVSLLLWFPVLMFIGMIAHYNSPSKAALAYVALVGYMAYPVLVVLGGVMSWMRLRKGQTRAAVIWNIIPLETIVVASLALVLQFKV